MVLHGFQKMTLLDFPGRVACTVFTGGCNFRCPFCHNAVLVTELSKSESIKEEEILEFLKKRKGLLDGVAITGGEPLISDDILLFAEKVKELGFAVKLDTNGSYPQRLKKVVEEGLVDYVAMDIKNSKELYAATAGLSFFDISDVEESVDFLLNGKVDYEFRTTVVNGFHTVESIENAAKWISGAQRYFLQNFIDSGCLIREGMTGVAKDEMILMKAAAQKYVPTVELRGV
ncbi:MAG: anaerobic ribonucleoside-triphosphate reductase activating protein [Clostridia bacterium]|nr:anaerobic ribonucleoside-triphosphate reductase activating protein [Clostridia bacterium]